jgi:predicted transcriptional regulator
MRRMRVGQFALWDMGGISPGQPLTYALRGGPRDVVVTEDGRVVGMLWRNSVLSALRGGSAGQTVADVMDMDVVTANVDDSVYDVQRQMSELSRRAVPVVEDGQYRGIFTADRFVHLYRQVNPSRLNPKYVAGMTTAANSLLRLWVR